MHKPVETADKKKKKKIRNSLKVYCFYIHTSTQYIPTLNVEVKNVFVSKNNQNSALTWIYRPFIKNCIKYFKHLWQKL